MVFGGKFRIRRCNSKASYLPRQSLEKQNNADPDHGSYKLTLNSNEDLVGTARAPYDILTAHNGKLPNNLPDVLPLGAKLQTLPSSPPSTANGANGANGATGLRYGSNNNLTTSSATATGSPTRQQAASCYPVFAAPAQQQRYSTPVLNSFALSANTFTRSQSLDTNANPSAHSPTRFMSQSTLDLKKPPALETTYEEPLTESPAARIGGLLAPATSEGHLNRKDSASGAVVESRFFRAERVNATLSASVYGAAKKSVTRQESLRENIEKITQLQSQLMSAHLSDNSLLGGYGAPKAVPNVATKPQPQPQPLTDATKRLTEAKGEKEGEGVAEAEVVSPTAAASEDKAEKKNYKRPTIESIKESSPSSSPPPPPSPSPPPSPLKRGVASASNTSPLPATASSSSPPPAGSSNSSTSSISPISSSTPQTLKPADGKELLAQLDSSTDGLKLVQRSEIILRVHPSTVEAASQTEDPSSLDADGHRLADGGLAAKEADQPTRTTLQPRRRHPIEEECAHMSHELASMLAPNDVLIRILAPPALKSAADYVSNLYNPNVPFRPSKRDAATSTLAPRHTACKQRDEQDPAERITVELQYTEIDVQPDNCDLMKRKMDELIRHLNRKVRILSKEQLTIGEESALNDELGNSLVSKLADKVRPIEATKCRTYIDDVGHITALLLSLSERLARAENLLSSLSDNSSEKKSLEVKRDRLLEQLVEAKRLKEDIDRRGLSVVGMLERHLSSDEFADFEFFINMKAKLITDARDVADKIKSDEEKLNALSEALIQSDC